MAFGSILSGLDTATLKPLVEQAMPTLIELMYDSSVMVSVCFNLNLKSVFTEVIMHICKYYTI